jgi:deoxyribose-phosphate aldolase
MIDLTTLNTTDGYERGKLFAEKVSQFPNQFPGMPNVAAICVYPSLVAAVKENLSAPSVKIASVAAGFPASQTFLEIKLSECEMALEQGADELDVVISVGSFLEGDYFTVFSELQQIKEVAENAKVKVILETGALPSLEDIKLASFLAMEAGSDFIKTSTGKLEPAATPEAVYVMCLAIKEFHEKTGRKVGMKPAGGVSNSYDAALFYTIVEQVLGQEWLYPGLFRFGTSRLADVLLSDILGKDVKYFSTSSSAKY